MGVGTSNVIVFFSAQVCEGSRTEQAAYVCNRHSQGL